MMKPGGARDGEDVQVRVERPYSHDSPPPPPPRPPPPPDHRQHQQLIRARPYYRRWSPWIVSAATLACIAIFVVTMAVNDCPKHNTNCFAGFLGRFAFQPLKENPLLGPSSTTYVLVSFLPFRPLCLHLALLAPSYRQNPPSLSMSSCRVIIIIH